MNDWQQKVNDFNTAIHAAPSKELVLKLIREETKELMDAIEADDEVEILDGACDAIVVILGAVRNRFDIKIDLDPFFQEVMRTNMLKVDGPIRADGKRLKPEGWEGPRIAELLAYQKGKANQ